MIRFLIKHNLVASEAKFNGGVFRSLQKGYLTKSLTVVFVFYTSKYTGLSELQYGKLRELKKRQSNILDKITTKI